MLVWDVDDLESLGLPPEESDIVLFCVKHFLPVHWIVANPGAFGEERYLCGELQKVGTD